jgi:hypothetical protein
MTKVKAVVNNLETVLYAEVESGQSVLMALELEAVKLLNDVDLLNSEVPTCLFVFQGHGFRVSKTGNRHWSHDGFSFDKFDVQTAVKQGVILARTARPF